MKPLDLNLLHIVVALHEERSVSRAAERLGVSQPTVSGALAKLRESLDDPLFVRAGGAMQPTEKALAMLKPIREMLATVRDDILVSSRFSPASVSTPVTVALSDVGEMVFMPRLMEAVRAQAPQATMRSVDLPHSALPEALESGQVDLAIGYFPDLARANIYQQRLMSHHFVCLLRAGHPLASRTRLTLAQFLQLEHAVVRAPGRSQEIFEQHLKDARIQRKVALTTPHFLSIPAILARSDLVVTVPHAMGIAFGRPEYGLKAVQPPFRSPRIELRQHWHRKVHKAPRTIWLRQLVARLFNDERDEWKQEAA
jgi:DNA-binding transcriptional LysR family regulator